MKSFSKWLIERETEDNKMTADVVKKINVDLFEYVKTAQPFDDLKETIPQIEDILENYNIVILNDKKQKFADKIIISLGEKTFDLASEDTTNDDIYEPYTNVLLNLQWNEKDRKYFITDVAIEAK